MKNIVVAVWSFGSLILTCSILYLSSCSYENKETNEKDLLLISVVSSEILDYGDMNEQLSSLWTDKDIQKDNVFYILSYLFPERNFASSAMSINKVRGNDFDLYDVAIIFDNIPDDDSVSGYRYDIAMKKKFQLVWEISEAKQSWRCWPGRGHRHFSIKPCL